MLKLLLAALGGATVAVYLEEKRIAEANAAGTMTPPLHLPFLGGGEKKVPHIVVTNVAGRAARVAHPSVGAIIGLRGSPR